MTNSVSRRYKLPVGFPNPTEENDILREVELIPMKGKVRKKLASEEIREQPQRGINYVFNECIKSIEGMETDEDIIKNMTGADRDFCVTKLRRISLGNTVTFNFNCSNKQCGAPISATINIDENVPVEKIDEETAYEMLEDDKYTFEITTEDASEDIVRETNNRGKFFLPTGVELKQIADTMQKNPIQAQHDLYFLCLISWNGEKRNEINFNPFDEEIAGVVDHFSQKFQNINPGPDMSFTFKCAECGQEMPADMQSSDFLFPTNQNEKT